MPAKTLGTEGGGLEFPHRLEKETSANKYNGEENEALFIRV